MTLPREAFDKLDEMLAVARLPKKASFNPSEVCDLLGISARTFQRMTTNFEMIDGRPVSGTIDSFRVGGARGQRRVRYHELARYINDNNSYQISCCYPQQLTLF